MQAATAAFATPFAPADSTLTPTNFDTFLNGIDTLNTDVAGLLTQYSTEVDVRELMVKDLKARTLRVVSYVESNAAWEKYARVIKKLADKIRGNRPRKPVAPAPGETPGSTAAKARNTGEQSFSEIAENFEQLVDAISGISGYTPPAAEITVASLTTLATDFSAKNKAMASLDRQITLKQKERLAAYDGPSGLKEKMLAIKTAVRAQYGAESAAYAAVKGIKV